MIGIKRRNREIGSCTGKSGVCVCQNLLGKDEEAVIFCQGYIFREVECVGLSFSLGVVKTPSVALSRK